MRPIADWKSTRLSRDRGAGVYKRLVRLLRTGVLELTARRQLPPRLGSFSSRNVLEWICLPFMLIAHGAMSGCSPHHLIYSNVPLVTGFYIDSDHKMTVQNVLKFNTQ